MDIQSLTAGRSDCARMVWLHSQGNTQAQSWGLEDFRGLMAGQGVEALLARENEVDSALLLTRRVQEEAEILSLVTHPTFRRKGLARALMLHYIAEAPLHGVERLFLEVGVDNPPALLLYESLAFRIVGRREGYYTRSDGRIVDALILEKGIAKPV